MTLESCYGDKLGVYRSSLPIISILALELKMHFLWYQSIRKSVLTIQSSLDEQMMVNTSIFTKMFTLSPDPVIA